MTMHSKNNVIRNLRAKNKKLVEKLEAVKNYIETLKKETASGLYQTTKQIIYRDLEKILEEK